MRTTLSEGLAILDEPPPLPLKREIVDTFVWLKELFRVSHVKQPGIDPKQPPLDIRTSASNGNILIRSLFND